MWIHFKRTRTVTELVSCMADDETEARKYEKDTGGPLDDPCPGGLVDVDEVLASNTTDLQYLGETEDADIKEEWLKP